MVLYKRVVPWALSLLMIGIAYGGEETGEELFVKANQSYKEGHFHRAIAQYEALLDSEGENGHVFFNLGNAYFRVNDLGRAILSYERARVHMPRDPDLAFNLRYAQDQMIDAISDEKTFSNMVFFWLDDLSPSEVYWLFVASHVLFFGLLVYRQFSRAEWSFYLLLFSMALWMVSGCSYGLREFQIRNDNRIVVLSEEVPVLAGPGHGNTILFKLHAGAPVRFERSEDGWSLIRLPDKKRGWVETSGIGPIRFSARTNQSNLPRRSA